MACMDPGIFVRGWGGGSRPDAENTALKTLLLFCAFLVLNLFYSSQRGSNGFITEKTTFPRNQRGSNIFRGWGPTFYSVGVQMLISIEFHILCDCLGLRVQSGPPIPPLDPHYGWH